MNGCITDFNPADVRETEGLLVVDGMIIEGTTTIRLSRSVGIMAQNLSREPVDGAAVWVECDDGTVYNATGEVVKGAYNIEIPELKAGSKYRLKITDGDMEYESGFLEPLSTPAIDDIVFNKDGEGQPIKIQVGSEVTDAEDAYFMWSYNEVWEVLSNEDYITAYDEEGRVIPYGRYRYCWIYNDSQGIILGTSEDLNAYYTVLEVSPSSSRFSWLYHIDIKQTRIREEAYIYFSNVIKNTESSGGLFVPIPSEINGNIVCVNNPDIPVIGYVDVTTRVEFGKYAATINALSEYILPIRDCAVITVGQYDLLHNEDQDKYTIYEYVTDGWPIPKSYIKEDCLDCRDNGGTKNKPDWWLTDEY